MPRTAVTMRSPGRESKFESMLGSHLFWCGKSLPVSQRQSALSSLRGDGRHHILASAEDNGAFASSHRPWLDSFFPAVEVTSFLRRRSPDRLDVTSKRSQKPRIRTDKVPKPRPHHARCRGRSNRHSRRQTLLDGTAQRTLRTGQPAP